MNCRSCVHFPICEYVESLGVGFKTLRIGSDAEKCVMFNNLKTIDAEPVRHGRWIFDNDTYFVPTLKCSSCGFTCGLFDCKYCPNCGAKMDEVSE